MRVGVYGIGNVLRMDDGFGPSVVERLSSVWALPEEVDLRDLGTPGLGLAAHLVGLDALILVDAVEGTDPPGTLRQWTRDEVLASDVLGCRTSTHEVGIREALRVTDAKHAGPRSMWLIGVIAASTETGTGLTPAVRDRVDEACRLVVRTLTALGLDAHPRPDPRPSGAWWESAGRPSS